MFSLKSLLAIAATVTAVCAQTRIAFSSVPAVAVAGQSYNITWGGGDGTAVTLTLREGNPTNLNTIGVIESQITGNSYLWTVDSSLPTASDYALMITQGVDGINYSGLFAIVGGTGTSSISYSGLPTSTSSSSMNGTIITTGVTSARGTAASMGTGTNLPRNTTFSSQSLSTGRTITTAASTAARTSTSTTASSTSAPTSNVGASMGSSAALVMGLFGAIMFLQ